MAEEDEIKTQMLTKAKWLPPVDDVNLLPIEGVEEGTRCFVDSEANDEEEVWVFTDGRWVHLETL
ncbi:MAG: hypothetical protein H6737_28240 [Alphaproteobacteria bacterium]|nr:hypothetical protein [Alphaproteobacteria bacterium]